MESSSDYRVDPNSATRLLLNIAHEQSLDPVRLASDRFDTSSDFIHATSRRKGRLRVIDRCGNAAPRAGESAGGSRKYRVENKRLGRGGGVSGTETHHVTCAHEENGIKKGRDSLTFIHERMTPVCSFQTTLSL